MLVAARVKDPAGTPVNSNDPSLVGLTEPEPMEVIMEVIMDAPLGSSIRRSRSMD